MFSGTILAQRTSAESFGTGALHGEGRAWADGQSAEERELAGTDPQEGYAPESRDFLSHAEADAWGLGRLAEITATDRLVDRRPAERTTFEAALLAYKDKVTAKRPDASSRSAEETRIGRFIREERKLCSYAIAHISTEMLEAWRDRRLTEPVPRGTPGGRGQYKAEVVPKGRLKKDGTPRANAAKPATTVSPSTVRREMTLLKRVFDFAMRHYKLAQNPMNRDLIDRPRPRMSATFA